MNFEGSAVFRTSVQEKPNCSGPIVRPVKIPSVRLAPVESDPPRLDLRTSEGGPTGARNTVQAMLVTLLAWTALLCAGLGGTVGVVSQTLAGKLAASVQHLQRHSGPSLSSRAVRRELPAVSAELRLAEASAAVVEVHADGAVPPGRIALPTAKRASDARSLAATEPRPAARHRMPPSRAPPLLA